MSDEMMNEAHPELSRIMELVGQFGASRTRIEEFIDQFFVELDRLRRDTAYQELKWSESAPAFLTAEGDDDREQLNRRLAEAEVQLQASRQQLERERATNGSQLDEEVRQLIDDLVAERDELQHELDHLRRLISEPDALGENLGRL